MELLVNCLRYFEGLTLTTYLVLIAGSVTVVAGKLAAEKYIMPMMEDDSKAIMVFLAMMALLGFFAFSW